MRVLLSRHRRLLSFALVGASGVVVNIAGVWAALQLLQHTTLPVNTREAAASVAGILISVLSNFLLNDVWTWGDREKRGGWLARLGRYCATSTAAGLVQFSIAVALSIGAGLDIYLAQLCGIVLGTGINYVVNNRWTFRER
jgi:dolichol-phosphate mannosyltransferase